MIYLPGLYLSTSNKLGYHAPALPYSFSTLLLLLHPLPAFSFSPPALAADLWDAMSKWEMVSAVEGVCVRGSGRGSCWVFCMSVHTVCMCGGMGSCLVVPHRCCLVWPWPRDRRLVYDRLRISVCVCDSVFMCVRATYCLDGYILNIR